MDPSTSFVFRGFAEGEDPTTRPPRPPSTASSHSRLHTPAPPQFNQSTATDRMLLEELYNQIQLTRAEVGELYAFCQQRFREHDHNLDLVDNQVLQVQGIVA